MGVLRVLLRDGLDDTLSCRAAAEGAWRVSARGLQA
jgi:hypothetical protein